MSPSEAGAVDRGEDQSAWSESRLLDLQGQFCRAMLPFAAEPIWARDPAYLVRGVVPSPVRRGVARVCLWDGSTLDDSVAYEVPLSDSWRGNVPAREAAAALRELLSSAEALSSAPTLGRDNHGMPVRDAVPFVRSFLRAPRYHLADAVVGIVDAFCPPPATRDTSLRLTGFLLLDPERVRLYLEGEHLPAQAGFDLPLHGQDGSITVTATGIATALPTLARTGELERMHLPQPDDYARELYDLSNW